jgi:hypothetical protein
MKAFGPDDMDKARAHLVSRGFVQRPNLEWYNEAGVEETLDDWDAVDLLRGVPATHACRACQNFSREVESWELPGIWWYECAALPGMANLASFPFRATKCKRYIPRGKTNVPLHPPARVPDPAS